MSRVAIDVPSYGFSSVQLDSLPPFPEEAIRFEVDKKRGSLVQLASKEFPDGVFREDGAFGLECVRGDANIEITRDSEDVGDPPSATAFSCFVAGSATSHKSLSVRFVGHVEKPDPGLNSAISVRFRLAFNALIVADNPYGVSPVHPIAKGLKKYPTGDWMTSPQWFEEVVRPFTALSFVDFVDADDPERGLLVIHDGNQQWFLEDERTARCIVSAYDPWDEDYYPTGIQSAFHFMPHGPLRNSQRWRLAQEHRCSVPIRGVLNPPELESFSVASATPENVVLTALYREGEGFAGRDVDSYAGRGMEYPTIVRLVEFDGIETVATLSVAGTVARAFKTNLLREIESELAVSVVGGRSLMSVPMRGFEIATVYLDIVEARKQPRDLDAARHVWATVHRIED